MTEPAGLPRLPRGPGGIPRRPARAAGPLPALVLPAESASRPFPAPPPAWPDTLAAWAIFWAHGPAGRGPEGERWVYAAALFGGWGADFIETDLQLAIDVNEPGRTRSGTAALRAAVFRSAHYRYLMIDAEDALATPIVALEEALAGISHARAV